MIFPVKRVTGSNPRFVRFRMVRLVTPNSAANWEGVRYFCEVVSISHDKTAKVENLLRTLPTSKRGRTLDPLKT